MNSIKFNCLDIFREAYNCRYTWPKSFNGYSGKCIFVENENSFEGEFILNSSFKPQIINISDKNVVKGISSQLFEVAIHRVKRAFNEVHNKNNFKFLGESEKGIEIEVLGKNKGDKYKVKDKKINMVFRKIHGVVIEIFVDEFLDTGDGFLSKKYTSQQLEIETLIPISKKFEYHDYFINLRNTNIWALESRNIRFIDDKGIERNLNYSFKELSPL